MPENFFGALLDIDGVFYIFDFSDKEIKEYVGNGKFKKWENKRIKNMPLDELSLIGITLRKMTKIVEMIREQNASV